MKRLVNTTGWDFSICRQLGCLRAPHGTLHVGDDRLARAASSSASPNMNGKRNKLDLVGIRGRVGVGGRQGFTFFRETLRQVLHGAS